MNSATETPCTYSQLDICVQTAKITTNNGAPSKSDLYVELIVDGGSAKRTNVQKKTNAPTWKESFTCLVTENSQLDFRLFSKSKIFDDVLIGQKILRLAHLFNKENCGKFNNQKLLLPLVGKEDAKVGEVKISLTGTVGRQANNSSDKRISLGAVTDLSHRLSSNSVVNGQDDDDGTNVGEDAAQLIDGIVSIRVDAEDAPTTSGAGVAVPPRRDSSHASSTPDVSSSTAALIVAASSDLDDRRRRSQSPTSSGAAQPKLLQSGAENRGSGSGLPALPSRPRRPPPVAPQTSSPPTTPPTDVAFCGVVAAEPPPASSSNVKPAARDVLTSPPPGSATIGDSAASGSTVEEQPLPSGWELRFDQYGRRYYVDHTTKSTTWERPSDTPLPAGWEIRRDPRGRIYYVDHNTRTTTWQRPTQDMLQAHRQWQSGREQAMQQWQQRFLYSNNPLISGDDPLGPLPEGWEKRFDPNTGKIYFVNHVNRTTQWDDPRTQGLCDQPLPTGWEMRFTEQGVPFFIDHNTKSTTYNDPRTGKPVGPLHLLSVPGEHSFRWKISQFRYLCLSNSMPNHVKISVGRQNLFEESFVEIMRKNAVDLRRRLYIQFKGEEGLDYGGIAREWFFLLSHEVLNPMYCLFEYAAKNNYSLQINPASFVNPDHLKYFEFIGRFVAMALFHGKFIYSGFTMPFYKKMLNRKLIIADLESVDSEFYNSLVWIKENNVDDCDLELYFVVDFELLGEIKTHELKADGTNLRVCEENKEEYINLMVQWRVNRGVEEQTKAFFVGFNSVFPIEWLQYFDERELELLLCGMQEIDVDDWQRNSVYRHYTPASKQAQWFWQFLRSLDNEKRARFLQFVTGTCRVPVGGFAELMGSNGPQLFCIEKVGKENWLPRSHTCFNRLDLPPYRSYDQLVEKLNRATEETEGFGNE